MGRSLVIGANGQIGSELVDALAGRDGGEHVIAADLAPPRIAHRVRFEALDVLDMQRLREVVERHRIDEVYQLAAMLSASAEAAPLRAWTLNVNGLLNVLELAREDGSDACSGRRRSPSSARTASRSTRRRSR
jgi:nucleoside-diphosphate-sugar epimerase